jgi:hypothetical protein
MRFDLMILFVRWGECQFFHFSLNISLGDVDCLGVAKFFFINQLINKLIF